MTYDTLRIEDHGDHIAELTLTRPDQLNSLDVQVLEELEEALEAVARRDGLRALVVRGEGRAFVAGADIKAMSRFDQAEATAFARRGHRVMDAASTLPFPTIAAIDGFALGGGLELALSCDILYASDRAKLGLPEVGLGLIPGFGGTQRLGRTIGWQRARELIFTGRRIGAEEAASMGLVCQVFPADGFTDKVFERAMQIASNGPIAVRTAKRVMRHGSELGLDEANALERDAFSELFLTDDSREGIEAFVEKREADFKGE